MAGPEKFRSRRAGPGGTGPPVVNRDKTALIGSITYESILPA